MIEDSRTIEVPYGKIHCLTLGKDAWKDTFPGGSFPKEDAGWQSATNIIVSKYTKLPTDKIFSLHQVHKREIALVESGRISDWIPDPSHFDAIMEDHFPNESDKAGDGLVTLQPNTGLVIRSADCVPIFCYSKTKPMIAALHSGWKGALLGISEKLIHWLKSQGFTEEELQVFAGPSISKKNYIVQWDVAKHFMSMPPGVVIEAPGMGYLLGVKEAILVRLRKEFHNLALDPQNNEVFLSPKYFSHRSKEEGRNFNVIFWES
ncbi:polyphenol oxidase family protein [Leptospira ilyithenensis]|uniref:Laccase domain-containing protein n=1 Tax=Leptospira ilyithenensis TaxID=2484901 RepID=A0A4R9LQD2_9LEPT|nr:polyphenol oxidase family protein [Leptospira ilyithenensis]TGN11711.1 laccase domain-containing protein [Leptospira ilyithenensis]